MAGSKEPISWQRISWTPREKKDVEQDAPVASVSDSSSSEEKPCYDDQPWLDPKYKVPLRQRNYLLWLGLTLLLLATIGAVIGIAFYLSTRGNHSAGSSVSSSPTDRGTTIGMSENTSQNIPKKRGTLWENTEATNFKDIFSVYFGSNTEDIRANTDMNPQWISGTHKKEKRFTPFIGAIEGWSSGSIFSTSDRQTIGSADYSDTPGTPAPGPGANRQPEIIYPDSKSSS